MRGSAATRFPLLFLRRKARAVEMHIFNSTPLEETVRRALINIALTIRPLASLVCNLKDANIAGVTLLLFVIIQMARRGIAWPAAD